MIRVFETIAYFTIFAISCGALAMHGLVVLAILVAIFGLWAWVTR